MALKPKPRSEMNMSDCSAKQQPNDNGVRRFQEEDLKVDIMELVNQMDDECQEVERVALCQAASSSSSFGDSVCGRDDDFGFGFGDEAQSVLSKDYPLPETSDGTVFLGLTKKKTDDRWKRLTQPLMWRCKWLELKVKEIQSQARGYEKEVKDYYLTKQFDLEKSKLEGFDGKSTPFRDKRMEVFKRGRRKRVEETTDVAAYMSNHNLFSYTDKRMPVNHKPQCHDKDIGAGRKATTVKEVGIEDDCLVSELDCSDDFLAKLLCKIDEAQGKARRLRKRVDQLMWDSPTAHTSSMPQTIAAPCPRDFRTQNGKKCAFVQDPLTRNPREATVQIGRQCISVDRTEHPLMPQTPLTQTGGQCLSSNSPISSKSLRFHPILEDLLMDEPDLNDDELEADDEKLDYFRKLINEITGVPPEEADAEEDPTPVTKKRKTSH